MTTLHVRCGSDIRDRLAAAGLGGDFLEYSDPVCEGPVPEGGDLVAVRAQYLARTYGSAEEAIAAGLRQAEDQLAAAWRRYERVVLWFEHDSYDQLCLARCLSRLAEGPLPSCLELICIDDHPEPKPRFIGLGQLSAVALAGLWPGRRAVTAGQIDLGQAIWAALRRDDPRVLQAIAMTGTPALPVAARALWRHLQELPGIADGLSLTQRIVLRILSEAAMPIGRVFASMVDGREPLVWMGDRGMLGTVERMAESGVLVIGTGETGYSRVASITDFGRRVLAGAVDYLGLALGERWIGGVWVAGGWPGWRFDEAAGRVRYM